MIKIGTRKTENIVSLADVKFGEVFRFAHEEFLNATEHGLFYMVFQSNDDKTHAQCVSLDGKEMRKFQVNHRVIIHKHDVTIYPN